jgi:hypothetical protein
VGSSVRKRAETWLMRVSSMGADINHKSPSLALLTKFAEVTLRIRRLHSFVSSSTVKKKVLYSTNHRPHAHRVEVPVGRQPVLPTPPVAPPSTGGQSPCFGY